MRPCIFCIESDWESDLRDQSSVIPVLDLVTRYHRLKQGYIYRRVGTFADFEHYFMKWCQMQYATYPILYVGTHGKDSSIMFGRQRIPFGEVAALFEFCKHPGFIHFGSCQTLNGDIEMFEDAIWGTNILGISGYKSEIDWMHSVIFELTYLGMLVDLSGITKRTLQSLRRELKQHPDTKYHARWFGFKLLLNRN